MGSSQDYKSSSLVILGAPMDYTVSFRPGTRLGPQHIRQVSIGIEEYSRPLDKELGDCAYYDAGDVSLPFGRVKESLHRIGAVVNRVLADGKFPLVLGGEHLITFPVVEQMVHYYPDLAIIHFDAHADLRDDYLGEKLSHATVMKRAAELVGGKNLYQFGIRSGTRDEFSYAAANTNMFVDEMLEPLKKVCLELSGRPVYITFDIDVLDPAYAPGTGTPEPGGCTPREAVGALHMLGSLNVVGMDLVEVSPVYDPTERTSLLAAKLVREAILSFNT